MSEQPQVHGHFRLTRGAFTLQVSLRIGGGVTGIIGPSGSGKTTLLRCLAGLERASEAQLTVAGECWQDARRFVPTHRRRVGYVFQEQALFPHLSVRENLTFGLSSVPPGERKVAFDDAVSLLGLSALLQRAPAGLSGGERQRVAIARALLSSPQLLLMDEPLASLDLASRAQILPYLEALQRALALPILYVTHAPHELTRLAERVLYLEAGRLRAEGPLNDVLTRADLPLSHREDAGAVLSGRVIEQLEQFHLVVLELAAGRLTVAERGLALGQTTRVLIRARDVSLALERPLRTSISNVLEATVLAVHADPEPAHRLVQLDLAGTRLLSRVTAQSLEQLGLAPGMRVFALVKSVALVA